MNHLENNRFVILTDSEEGKKPKHLLSDYKKYEDVKDLDNLAVLMDKPYVVVDVDDEYEYLILKKIVKSEKLKCRIMKTTRGGHFWFSTEEPVKNYTHMSTALTLTVDYRSWGKESYVKVKQDGEWREWDSWEDEVDPLPYWLNPIKHQYKFVNSKSGDGRNTDLFSYIITLVNNGYTKAQVKTIFQLINGFLFADKLSSDELNTILRDESFDKIRPAFYHPKSKKFLHDVFSTYFKNDNKVYERNGRLFMYADGYYSDSPKAMESRMIKYIPQLSKTQRKEVLEYLKLIGEEPRNTSIYHIVCSNGLLDIRDGKLLPYTSDLFITNKVMVDYVEGAYSKSVDDMLDKITCNNREVRDLLEEMIGYCLIPTAKFQKAFILYGGGSNGKSTLLDMLVNLLGDENISSLSLKELNHNFRLSDITSKMANIGDDISEEYLTDTSIFKKLVTGEEVMVEKKHIDSYKIRNTAKMIFATNNMPTTMDKSNGMIRRLSIIPFNAVISKTDPDYDPFIIDKLTSPESRSYLFALAVKGIQRVFENNKFTEPQSVVDMVSEYEKENNNVLQFVEEIEVLNRDSSEVYQDYKYWCVENGVSHYKIRKFNQEVRSHLSYELQIEKIGGRTGQVWRNK